MLLKSVPHIIPINSTNITLAFSLLNISLYKTNEPNIINTKQIKKLILLSVTKILVDPNTNINIVCTATYNESIPITLGVSILLFVTVWNIIVENPIHPPVSTIAINFGTLFERAYS